jgi:hypothetical protein
MPERPRRAPARRPPRSALASAHRRPGFVPAVLGRVWRSVTFRGHRVSSSTRARRCPDAQPTSSPGRQRISGRFLVEPTGIEPVTSCLQRHRSNEGPSAEGSRFAGLLDAPRAARTRANSRGWWAIIVVSGTSADEVPERWCARDLGFQRTAAITAPGLGNFTTAEWTEASWNPESETEVED